MISLLAQVTVVPLPVKFEVLTQDLYNIGDFALSCSPDCVADVQDAYGVYSPIFFPKGAPNNKTAFPLEITVKTLKYGATPQVADEYYELVTN